MCNCVVRWLCSDVVVFCICSGGRLLLLDVLFEWLYLLRFYCGLLLLLLDL